MGGGPLVFAVVATASVANAIGKLDGLPQRMPNGFNTIMAETKNSNPYGKGKYGHPKMSSPPWCVVGGKNVEEAVVIGDSHAASIFTAVREALVEKSDDSVVMATYTSCQPLGIKKTNKQLRCSEFYDFVDEKLNSLPEEVPVIIGARMSATIFGSHLPFDKSFRCQASIFGEEPVGQVTKEFLADVRERIISSACYWSEQRKVY